MRAPLPALPLSSDRSRASPASRSRPVARPLFLALVLASAPVVAGCVGPWSLGAEDVAGEALTGVVVRTDYGNLVLVLYPELMPRSSAHFLSFADARFYEGRIWERVVDNFVIQSESREGDPPGTLALETHPEAHFAAGVIGFARDLDEDSATHVFFITEYPQPHLHEEEGSTLVYGRFAAFGQLVAGWDVLRAIAAAPKRLPPEHERPVDDIHITRAARVPVLAPRECPVAVPGAVILKEGRFLACDFHDLYPRQVAGRVSVNPYRVSLEHQRTLAAHEPVSHFAWFVESQLDRSEDTRLALTMTVERPDGSTFTLPLRPDVEDGNVHYAPGLAFDAEGVHRVSVDVPALVPLQEAAFTVQVGPLRGASASSARATP